MNHQRPALEHFLKGWFLRIYILPSPGTKEYRNQRAPEPVASNSETLRYNLHSAGPTRPGQSCLCGLLSETHPFPADWKCETPWSPNFRETSTLRFTHKPPYVWHHEHLLVPLALFPVCWSSFLPSLPRLLSLNLCGFLLEYFHNKICVHESSTQVPVRET